MVGNETAISLLNGTTTTLQESSKADWSQAGKLFGLGFSILLIWGFIIMLTARRQLFRRLLLQYCCCRTPNSPEKRLSASRVSLRARSQSAQPAELGRRPSKISDLRRQSQQLVLLDSRNSVVAATAPRFSVSDRRSSRTLADPILVYQDDETGEEVAFYPVQPMPINEESEEDSSSRASIAEEVRKMSNTKNIRREISPTRRASTNHSNFHQEEI